MKRFMIVAALALVAIPARADKFSYNCRVNGKKLKVKIDDVKNTLIWRGNVYKIKTEGSCAKFGWRVERPGEAFNFCTATQGYADFQEGDKLVQCDQDR